MEKDANASERKFKPRYYFIIGYLLLLAMALCWSLDDSFVYILLGSAAYFLFMGFYTNASGNKLGERNQTRAFHRSSSSSFFSAGLKNILGKWKRPQTNRPGTFNQSSARSKRNLLPLVMLAIFATFFIFLVGSLFTSGNDESPDYFTRAEQQYWQGEYDSAYVNYRRAWKADETNVEAMVGYGNVLALRKLADSAVIMYDKGIALDPEHLPAAYAKAALYYNLEKYNECIAVMNPLLQENQGYYDGMLLIGDCYYTLRQFDDAIGWYANAYENGGSRSSALCHIMAYIYDTKGDQVKAINLYKEALTYDSTIVDIYRRLGELLPNDDGSYYRTQAVRLQQP